MSTGNFLFSYPPNLSDPALRPFIKRAPQRVSPVLVPKTTPRQQSVAPDGFVRFVLLDAPGWMHEYQEASKYLQDAYLDPVELISVIHEHMADRTQLPTAVTTVASMYQHMMLSYNVPNDTRIVVHCVTVMALQMLRAYMKAELLPLIGATPYFPVELSDSALTLEHASFLPPL